MMRAHNEKRNMLATNGISLESATRQAVFSERNTCVIAGPGAGKTELLAQRALYLLESGICRPPRRILAICFKRDAAVALKDRIAARCTNEQAKRFESYTFDAFSKSLVDRFLALTPEWCRPSQEYQIKFTNRSDQNYFRKWQAQYVPGGIANAHMLNIRTIEKWGPLPLQLGEQGSREERVGAHWWEYCRSGERPGISFPMITRLAEAILRYNPDVLRAIRITYSHVFLDEFQDTTELQYDFTKLAFCGSSSTLTAVGDTKQRIMTWAGAEPEVFSWFADDFDAQNVKLDINYRSSARIVQIVNDLTEAIEPEAIRARCGRGDSAMLEDVSNFWLFDTDEQEAEFLANFIANDVNKNGLKPGDFALLVRVRADDAENRLKDQFARHGLKLRNEARVVHGVAIQDLLSEKLTSVIVALIKLAIGARGGQVYHSVQETISALLGSDFENPRDTKILDEKIKSVLDTVKELTIHKPHDTDMTKLIATVVRAIGEIPLRRTFRQYENKSYFLRLQESLAELFEECSKLAIEWRDFIDAVEGVGQVRLMTIHKSKGLEFHTVVVVGLHINSFWNYKINKSEEENTFFVALSRARERLYFTRSREAGSVDEIQGLIDLLDRAKIEKVECK